MNTGQGSGYTVSELLCSHIDLLRKQHRAGITPTFGQVEDLFDLSDRLRVTSQRDAAEQAPPARPTTCAYCSRTVAGLELVAGRAYCRDHVGVVADVLRHLQTLVAGVPQQARVAWPEGHPQQTVEAGP